MNWTKKGLIYCPDGSQRWAQHSFMTPTPWQKTQETIRLFGGMRDADGISRIGWIDVSSDNPQDVVAVSNDPVLDLGEDGMFDDNGVILGDVIEVSEDEVRMYYVGFQLVQKAKFLAFTGVAISRDRGETFQRVQKTPILDRCDEGQFIGALHSVARLSDGTYRAWISRGNGWENIEDKLYPQYDCWTLTSDDGIYFDNRTAQKIIPPCENEYRIGRPRATLTEAGNWVLRATSDTYQKQYESFVFHSQDGVSFERKSEVELPRGSKGSWDSEMTCYPAYHRAPNGRQFLFYNGNDMGRSGVGFAEWIE